MEELHPGDGLEVDVERHVGHHLAGQVAQDLALVETLLRIPRELAPGLHPLQRLRVDLVSRRLVGVYWSVIIKLVHGNRTAGLLVIIFIPSSPGTYTDPGR